MFSWKRVLVGTIGSLAAQTFITLVIDLIRSDPDPIIFVRVAASFIGACVALAIFGSYEPHEKDHK